MELRPQAEGRLRLGSARCKKKAPTFHFIQRGMSGTEWERRIWLPVQLAEHPAASCLFCERLRASVFSEKETEGE